MTIHCSNGIIDDNNNFVAATATTCEIAYSPWSELCPKSLQNQIEKYFEHIFHDRRTDLESFCNVIRNAMHKGSFDVSLVLVKKDDESNSFGRNDFLHTFLRKAFGEESINGSMRHNIFDRKVAIPIRTPSTYFKYPPCIYFRNALPVSRKHTMNVFFYCEPEMPLLHDALEQAFLSFILREKCDSI